MEFLGSQTDSRSSGELVVLSDNHIGLIEMNIISSSIYFQKVLYNSKNQQHLILSVEDFYL